MDKPVAASEAIPQPFTHADPRCIEVQKKLARARMRMVALGIPLLLENRPAWKRVTPAPAFVIRHA